MQKHCVVAHLHNPRVRRTKTLSYARRCLSSMWLVVGTPPRTYSGRSDALLNDGFSQASFALQQSTFLHFPRQVLLNKKSETKRGKKDMSRVQSTNRCALHARALKTNDTQQFATLTLLHSATCPHSFLCGNCPVGLTNTIPALSPEPLMEITLLPSTGCVVLASQCSVPLHATGCSRSKQPRN